ncbi:MAG: hypothetical protein U1F55_14610 [Chitinivorax sp.]
MTAFNYRQLIRQVPPTTWQYYFQTRKIELPADLDWSSTSEKITDALVEVAEALDPTTARIVYGELRRVWALGNRRGVDALRNMAQLDSPIHDDFPKLTSDAERALWVMANWPDLFETAESIFSVNQRVGGRGWKRLKITGESTLFRGQDDLRALEQALATEFTPKKGSPRACQIESFDRHLDGGVQLGILIEDNAQRQLEFGEDNRTHWRDVRPPLNMDLVLYPDSGIIDVLVPGGAKAQQRVLKHVGTHIFRRPLTPQNIEHPPFFLNRLRDGFELFDDSEVDLAAHRVGHIRLSQARVRTMHSTPCDYTIKPPAGLNSPDVLACVKANGLSSLMGSCFNIVEATVSLHFLPDLPGKSGRTLHAELRQNGISNLRDLEENDVKLVEALLCAWGVMQKLDTKKSDNVDDELALEVRS